MRNYVSVFATYWAVSATSIDGHGMGSSQAQANGVAQNNAIQWGGGIADTLTDLGRFYYPLSQSIIGAIIAITQESPKNGPWNLLSALEQANDLTPQISPLKHGAYPYNPKGLGSGRKSKPAIQEMSLLNWLRQLLFSWENAQLYGIAQTVPQRWLEALQVVIGRYAAGKISPTQVYAWLNSIDFSAKATTI